MTEFSIIKEHCHGVGPSHKETVFGIGDDAALLVVPDGMELAVSVDSMVAGVHFFADVSPAALAHKLLAVNLSDMAAMGADPKWATMTLTLPSVDRTWLNEFSNSLRQTANQYQVQLIGGDTTQGSLNLSLNIMGLVPKGKALSRQGAQSGDDVYLSNVVGDAALGLQCLQGELNVTQAHQDYFVNALERPTPRVALGQGLRELATACLDISDGLLGDLKHICERSQVAIDIDVDRLPLSASYSAYLANGGTLSAALTGGDDYELAFTAAPEQRDKVAQLAKVYDIALTRIGTVTANTKDVDLQKVSLTQSGKAYTLTTSKSFEHFS